MKAGFTLIELLVVVLIIGILAAIALPQYQKAVERSRLAEAVQKMGDLATAQNVYYMQQGVFAESIDALNTIGDITLSSAEFPMAAAEGKSWHFTINPSDDGRVEMLAIRDGGIYNGTTLQVVVSPNGSIFKGCANRSGTDKLCEAAETSGYSTR